MLSVRTVLIESWSRSGEVMGSRLGLSAKKKPMAPEVIVAKQQDLPKTFLRRLEALAAEAFRARGRFAIALPGGSVATAFLPLFPTAAVDWARADLFWGDERAV